MSTHTSNRRLRGAAVGGAALGLGAWALYRSSQRHRFPVRDRVVLITGSSRGLGLALAERFARAGAYVALTARDPDALNRARSLLLERGAAPADRLFTQPCDLRDEAQVQALFQAVEQTWRPVEVLINNAGIISVGPLESQSLENYRNSMQTNFYGMLHCTLATLPAMLRRGRGTVVNIASIGGKVAVPHLLPYSASKFACVGFSQGLHAELRSKGIRVTTVCPGLLRTGSPVHALFTGRREQEFRWFNLGASLPGVSRNAYGAAGRILRATESGEAELNITPQAAFAARFAALFPSLTAQVLSLVNQFALPAPAPGAAEPIPGRKVSELDLRMLTGRGRAAERQWNEA